MKSGHFLGNKTFDEEIFEISENIYQHHQGSFLLEKDLCKNMLYNGIVSSL